MKPILQALVLADHIYQDRITGKMVIAGTFTNMFVGKNHPAVASVKEPADQDSEELETSQFSEQQKQMAPLAAVSLAGSPFAYLCLTNIHELVHLELRFVHLPTGSVLINADLEVKCPNPLQSVELSIPLPALQCRHLGVYSLELHCENELIGSWRVTVHPPIAENDSE